MKFTPLTRPIGGTIVLLFPLTFTILDSAQAQPPGPTSIRRPLPAPIGPSGEAQTGEIATLPITAAQLTLGPDVDALHRRVRTELRRFTDWLVANNAKGYIGEVGWPNKPTGDNASWNALADKWYTDADEANLWVTAWASGARWGTGYNLGIYEATSGSTINSVESQGPTVEAHLTTPNYMRGVSASGGEFATEQQFNFSNANPGTYGTNYSYDNQASFNYLASRGVKLVRIPFRWERLQPNLSQPFNSTEFQRIKDVVTRAQNAGLDVVLDMHNYASYVISVNGTRTSKNIGSTEVPISAYTNAWVTFSNAFKSKSGVYYGIMNEPTGITITINGLTGAKLWEKISQDCVNAIRANGDTNLIMVPGYGWSGAQTWKGHHPTAWITDSANNFRYEAHHYWDKDNSGNYDAATETYAQTLAAAQSAGYKASPTTTVVGVDNTTSIGVDFDGDWGVASTLPGRYLTDYRHDNNTDKGTKRALYQPTLGLSGNYKVFFWHPANANNDNNVPVDIRTINGVQTVYVNQQANGGAWHYIGTFPFSYTNAYVAIRTDNTTKTVIADGMRFELVP